MTQGSGEPVSDRDESAGAVERRSWLEERVYGGTGATAAEVAELRRLVTAGEPAGTEGACCAHPPSVTRHRAPAKPRHAVGVSGLDALNWPHA